MGGRKSGDPISGVGEGGGSARWPGRLPWKTAIDITWKILTSPINAVHACCRKLSIKGAYAYVN